MSTAWLCPLGAIPWDLCWQQSVSLSGPWVCPSMAIPIFYGVMTLKIKKKFLAFTLTASPVCLFPLNSIFLIWVVAFWWQFTIASQKGIVLKCWNALTSTWKTVPCMILTYIPSHPHRCLCLLPWWKDHPPSISGWSLWHFGSHTQHIPPERTDYFINSHSVLHLQPSPSSLAGSFPEATKLKALSHLKKNKVLFWSPLLF